jgi:hypothetical protein
VNSSIRVLAWVWPAVQGRYGFVAENLELVKRRQRVHEDRAATGDHALLDARAPERFRLEIRDLTRYPAGNWPRNDVSLISTPRGPRLHHSLTRKCLTLPSRTDQKTAGLAS